MVREETRNTSNTWSAVGRRDMVQWAEDHATPAARRTRCHVAPPAHHTGAIAQQRSNRLSAGRMRVQLPLVSFIDRLAQASGARAVLHHPAPEAEPIS